jgi:hypothetical protein
MIGVNLPKCRADQRSGAEGGASAAPLLAGPGGCASLAGAGASGTPAGALLSHTPSLSGQYGQWSVLPRFLRRARGPHHPLSGPEPAQPPLRRGPRAVPLTKKDPSCSRKS